MTVAMRYVFHERNLKKNFVLEKLHSVPYNYLRQTKKEIFSTIADWKHIGRVIRQTQKKALKRAFETLGQPFILKLAQSDFCKITMAVVKTTIQKSNHNITYYRDSSTSGV